MAVAHAVGGSTHLDGMRICMPACVAAMQYFHPAWLYAPGMLAGYCSIKVGGLVLLSWPLVGMSATLRRILLGLRQTEGWAAATAPAQHQQVKLCSMPALHGLKAHAAKVAE